MIERSLGIFRPAFIGLDHDRSTAVLFMLLAVALFVPQTSAQIQERKPAAVDPSAHAFPALGATSERKVSVEWNRFYDHAGLGGILARLHEQFPRLTRLYSIGKSVEGRDLWCLEVTRQEAGQGRRKPGMWIDGNIHG